MSASQLSVATITRDGSSGQKAISLRIGLGSLPPIFVLPTYLSSYELDELKAQLSEHGATLTYDIFEAKLVLGVISTSKRARLELQWKHLKTEPIEQKTSTVAVAMKSHKRKHSGASSNDESIDAAVGLYDTSSTESESGNNDGSTTKSTSKRCATQMSDTTSACSSKTLVPNDISQPCLPEFDENVVLVVKTDWWTESLRVGKIPPMDPYVVYKGKIVPNEVNASTNETKPKTLQMEPFVHSKTDLQINESALKGVMNQVMAASKFHRAAYGKRDRVKDAVDDHTRGSKFVSSSQRTDLHARGARAQPLHLLRQTTSEHDEDESPELPEMPQWVKENKIYSCERATPLHCPNDDFIEQLKKIKLARTLVADEIGVRAYSTSIASLAAYPYKLSSDREILALPGCDHKIAHLYHEWRTSGNIEAVEEFEADPVMKVLRAFYSIWGVGATTARQFYYDGGKEWRDFDDVIINGWNMLSRVQQIGLKFHDEFEAPIPRLEVESIASIVTKYARQLVDDGIESTVVGGYRRGKPDSGDVDIILSHREEEATHGLITPMVNILEKAGWITHCLTLSEANSRRNQRTLLYRSSENRGVGFDTLDKALVVWQNPEWATKEEDLATNPKAKNPNVHRRVDIIISPWRTVGCAIVGWSGGTTFERDLRRYAKHMKGWKFDSSGVRQRGTGKWVDLERWTDPKTRARTWQEAERRVFEGFGLEFREPWERCTG